VADASAAPVADNAAVLAKRDRLAVAAETSRGDESHMFKTIVWADDGSEPAEKALPLVMGSVTNRPLHLAPCPVLVVPAPTPAA
jgi:hypothetical protein